MDYFELSNEQARQQIDVQQLYRSWREKAVETWNEHGGKYTAPASWRKAGNREYLVLRTRGIRKHIGPRSEETEAYEQQYTSERNRTIRAMKARLTELKKMAPVNRALGLGRVPKITAEVIRQLDQFGYLGTKAVVIGTNALYAYEALLGVHIRPALMETTDADFLWDAKQKLRLAIANVPPPSVIALLKKADKTFEVAECGMAAKNDKGFIVELISPAHEDGLPFPTGLGEDDIEIMPYANMEGLLSLPKFEAIAIDRSGLPLKIVVPDIRAFALHKLWTSRQISRKPAQRRRDKHQARVLTQLSEEQLGLSLKDPELSAVPKYLISD